MRFLMVAQEILALQWKDGVRGQHGGDCSPRAALRGTPPGSLRRAWLPGAVLGSVPSASFISDRECSFVNDSRRR